MIKLYILVGFNVYESNSVIHWLIIFICVEIYILTLYFVVRKFRCGWMDLWPTAILYGDDYGWCEWEVVPLSFYQLASSYDPSHPRFSGPRHV